MASGLRSLNDLPNEILLKILSHFGPEDLCLIMAKVCERWNILAKDVALWKTLSYTCVRTSDTNRITEVLTAAPALHSLIIHQRDDVADILEFLNHIDGDLRKLILIECVLGEDGDGLLADIVALYPDLEGLSLEGCSPLTSAGYCLIPHLQKLTELSLSKFEGLSGETVRFIVDSCQHLKKLNLLYVEELFDDDVIYVINRLGEQLTTLVLGGQRLTDVAYSYLQNCARLQELEVSCCKNMTDRGLLEGIGSLHQLTSLRLSVGRILTVPALSTFLHRPSMTSIVLLDLSLCFNLDDEGLKGIAERCIHLKVLTVSYCDNVTDAGISIVIRNCNQLRILDLVSLNNVTGEGWMALVASHLPHLRRLCLMGCYRVCNEYVEELVAAAPELKVIRRWE